MKNKFYHIMTMFLICAGCATAPEPEKKGPPEPVFYTLRSVEPIEHAAPLPNQISIFVDWKMSDGSKVTKEGFRGWDFSHVGRFDALEVLAADGSTTAWAYDFDGDGTIDAIEETGMAAIAAAKGPAPIPSKDEAQSLLQYAH